MGNDNKWIWLVLIVVNHQHSPALGYSTGAPDSACDSMIPSGHDAPGDVGPAPFDITLSQDTYSTAENISDPAEPSNITITISRNDGSDFKGFLIQARRVSGGNEKIGTFVINPDDGKHNCDSDCLMWMDCSVTHKDNLIKNTITVFWIAPITSEGDIVIRATFVESKSPSVYWAQVDMATITEECIGESCNSTTPGSTGSTASEPITTTTPMVPIDLTSCGADKGCFRSPSTCEDSTTCDYLLTWTPRDTQIDFEISSRASNGEKWTAIGLSLDEEMGDDSVTDCVFDETTQSIIVQSSWNDISDNSLSNIVLQNRTLGLVEDTLTGSYSGGVIQCAYTRWKNQTSYKKSWNTMHWDRQKIVDQIYDFDEPYYLLIARGDALGSDKLQHLLSPSPLVSELKVDLNEIKDLRGETISTPALIITHGSLMIIAWMLLASLGVLMPRHFKPAWKETMWFSKLIWFQIHRAVMIAVFTLTCVAFILIFIEVGGYSKMLSNADAAHPILGIIVTILTIINPFMALFRPGPDAKNRPIFNVAHFSVGMSAFVLAGVTMFLGTRLQRAGMSEWARWIVLSFIIWHCIVESILFIHQYCVTKSAERSITPTQSAADLTSQIRENKSTGSLYSENWQNITSKPSTVELFDLARGKVSTVIATSIQKTVIISVHFAVCLCFVIAIIVDLIV